MKQTIKAGDKVRMLEDVFVGNFVESYYTFRKGEVYTVKLGLREEGSNSVQVYTEDQEDYWFVNVSKFELVEPSDASNIDDEQQEDKETLRDKFAMAALTGNLAYSHVNPSCGNYQENCSESTIAERCYMMADAMMEARKK